MRGNNESANARLAAHLRSSRHNITRLVANVALPLALLLVTMAPSVGAAPRGQNSAGAASLGLLLSSDDGRLMVRGVNSLSHPLGVRIGDQIVAVNGRKVSTEEAFMNRLSTWTNGKQAASIVVARNNRLQTMNAAVPQFNARLNLNQAGRNGGGGFMNPDIMVMTSQGVMHKDAAERLGLEGTPINGSPEHDGGTSGTTVFKRR